MVEYIKEKKIIFEITDDLDVKEQVVEKANKKTDKKAEELYTKYLNIGFYLMAPLLFGVFFGLYLDSKFEVKPFFTMTGIGLGILCTFYNLWKLTKD